MGLVINIGTEDPKEAKRQVIQAIEERMGGAEHISEVRMCTDTQVLPEDYNHWPLLLTAYYPYTHTNEEEGTTEEWNLRIEVNVYCASSGSDSAESQLTKEILEYCGFQNLPERITTETFHMHWFNKDGKCINEERVAWLKELLRCLGHDVE